jgi:hypothetical protein
MKSNIEPVLLTGKTKTTKQGNFERAETQAAPKSGIEPALLRAKRKLSTREKHRQQ